MNGDRIAVWPFSQSWSRRRHITDASDPSVSLPNHNPETSSFYRRALQKIKPFLKRKRRFVVLTLLTVVLVALFATNRHTTAREHVEPIRDADYLAAVLAWNASLSVLVFHSEPLTCLNQLQRQRYRAGQASETVMPRSQLPSWTMHVVEAECAECLDSATHAAALKRQLGNGALLPSSGAAVFSTPSAPLGLVGPMLFAMASVTDNVAVDTELARWGWVGRSKAVQRQFAGASPVGLKGGTTPYLVVMGIPSVDQPVRATLRDAQRATWLSYRDVARGENGFDGALLLLYIFAAAEREMTQGVTDVSPLLPTVSEYEAASTMLLPRGKDDGAVLPGYTERRVELVDGLKDIPAGDARLSESPCVRIVSKKAAPTALTSRDVEKDTTWVSQVSASLQLPVRPAAVAPAAFICHASTALWQEALAHRNVLWVDMLTDRRPTSGKKIGQGGNWGLPVEVGMSQKLVLWLEYAYHAFPDVPYIMKSDDDTYVKVPQFVSDIRYIRAGFRGKRVPTVPGAPRDPIGIEETEECIYWGSKIRNPAWNNLRYHAGSGYLLHRRLVQASLEISDHVNAEVLYLAVTPFHAKHKRFYEELVMNIEDAFVGRMLRDKRQRIRELCPNHTATYIEEGRSRHLDLHTSRRVEWDTVVMHHCTPPDEHYLHYYFQREATVAAWVDGYNKKNEGGANRAALEWMRSNVGNHTTGYNKFPKVRWTHEKHSLQSFIPDGDNVTVYNIPYGSFSFDALDKAYRSITPGRKD